MKTHALMKPAPYLNASHQEDTMTSDLGLDTLTDDQIIELARALATEMASRDPSVTDAAKQAVADAAAHTAAGQAAQWATKKWLALMVTTHIGSGYTLNVWCARDRDETRVYLETPGKDRRGRDAEKFCLYVTGNDRHPPGSLTRTGRDADSRVARMIMQHAFETHPGGVTIECDTAAATTYAVPAEPQDVADYMAQKRAREAHAAQRAAYSETVRRTEMAEYEAQVKAAVETAGCQYEHQIKNHNAGESDRLDAIRAAALNRINTAMTRWDAENREPS